MWFGTANDERFIALCRARQWDRLTELFRAEGKSKGTATRFTNETRLFFEDDGTTLWITFMGGRLWWGFLTSAAAEPHSDGGVWRKVAGGWRQTDRAGERLTNDRLSGAVTKYAAYRGTSCRVDVADYVVRRINGLKVPAVEGAIGALEDMRRAVLDLMQLLQWRDFETLVDLLFSTSGWRRQGQLGKMQKTLDLDLVLPSTGERAFVQVKSKTTSAELAEYVGQLDGLSGPYDRMFYVFHSGEASTDDDRVTVLGPEKLAEMVVNAGLATWLLGKVS